MFPENYTSWPLFTEGMSDEFVWICRRDLQNGKNITVLGLQQVAIGYQTD